MADELITAVIIDDHPATITGVRYWCERADPPITLIDAGARLADVWTGPGGAACVVIFDLDLEPNKTSFGELRRLADDGRHVIVYSQHADNATAIKCVKLGALAYLTKAEGEQHLIPAIRAAAGGQSYTAPSLSGAFVADNEPGNPRLSAREIDVMRAWFACSSKTCCLQAPHQCENGRHLYRTSANQVRQCRSGGHHQKRAGNPGAR
ncbi:response regulator [Amycolatopsis aidingensis]|uniref:response regulator n=1 Tax=Amycolatopsis aidingensis TaxID=2842453 RepID=UPI001E4DB45B|nr:response regulator [Amycolatopsis aidingensis]